MSAAEVGANALAALQGAVKHIPKKWANVQVGWGWVGIGAGPSGCMLRACPASTNAPLTRTHTHTRHTNAHLAGCLPQDGRVGVAAGLPGAAGRADQDCGSSQQSSSSSSSGRRGVVKIVHANGRSL
jgi:hypothetical protein